MTRLFDYARAEAEERLPVQVTDLARAVAEAAASFEFAAAERDVQLRVGSGAGPAVAIDRDGFERALASVIDNALHHSPPGGAVDVGCGEDGEGAFVRVVDDGPGIAPGLLPRLFEPLARTGPGHHGRTGGAGLGLAIAGRLLHRQGGTIHAANSPERGAIVTLRLRLSRAPSGRCRGGAGSWRRALPVDVRPGRGRGGVGQGGPDRTQAGAHDVGLSARRHPLAGARSPEGSPERCVVFRVAAGVQVVMDRHG